MSGLRCYALLLLSVALVSAGCGQKGALYQPVDQPAANAPAPADGASDTTRNSDAEPGRDAAPADRGDG